MSTSPEPVNDRIVRGSRAQGATAARFQVDFRRTTEVPIPAELLEQARASAVAAGYAEGWAQGVREATAEAQAAAQAAQERARAVAEQDERDRAAALQQAAAAVLAAADRLAQREVPVLAELEDVVLGAAVELAEALLGRALASSPEPGLDALRRVLALTPDGGSPVVRLHPEDLASLGAPEGDHLVDGRVVRLRPDPTLARGDAVAEYGASTIDARLSAAVQRVRAQVAR